MMAMVVQQVACVDVENGSLLALASCAVPTIDT
jgi:hypothetical protein